MRRVTIFAVLIVTAIGLAGCRSNGELPPVFGAVFGLSGAASTPFELGKIPEKMPSAGDRIVGEAANNPGLCIWLDRANRRFRAACPEGYAP